MKIAVNTRLLIKNKLDGIGWFSYETLKRITAQHPEHEFIFLFDRKFSDEFIFSNNIKPVVVHPQARHPFLFYLWFEHSLPKILKKEKVDLFLSPDGFTSLSIGEKMKCLSVIHDLNFEERPNDLPFLVSKYYRYYFPKFAKRADRIATVSQFSKRDIVKRYKISPGKIDVVYNGTNENYVPISVEEKTKVRNKYVGRKEFFLFVGNLHPRKNIANMMKAFEKFKKEFWMENIAFVVAGTKMWWNSDMESAYKNMRYKKSIIFTGRMEPDELSKLTASALAMVYVSHYEGFGIPIIEAMNCDVPVITSNITAMPETAGDAALLVNPSSVDEIKNAMTKIFNDKNLRDNLIAKGKIQREKFSWDKTAGLLWNSIEKTVSQTTK